MAPTTTRRTLEKKEAMATLTRGGGGTRAGKQRRDDAVNCKKHPKHSQEPGVCAVCLSERLADLAAKKERKGFRAVLLMVRRKRSREDEDDDSLSSSPSSVSSYYSSSLGSSCSSPMHEKYVISKEAKGSSSSSSTTTFWSSNLFTNGKSVLLTKSRSLAFVPRDINGDGDHEKRSTGFWSKLTLRNSSRHSKRVEGQANLVHSKTTREITV